MEMIKAMQTFDYMLRLGLFIQPQCKKVISKNTKGVGINQAENSDLKSNLFRGKMTLQEVDTDN